jgi:hypothetical protein
MLSYNAFGFFTITNKDEKSPYLEQTDDTIALTQLVSWSDLVQSNSQEITCIL